MFTLGLRRMSLSTGAMLLMGAASTASAQERRLFEWTGSVDREVQIIMRGREVWTRDIGNNEPRRHQERVSAALPRTDGQVMVRLADGRGDVDVIQQPSARNNYTTIVRLRDNRGGADRYRVDAYWEPYSNGRWDNRTNGEVYPSNRDDRNGVYDRNDRSGVYGRDGVDNRDRAGERGTRGTYGDYNRSVMHWSGDVDDVLEIRIQGQRIDYRTLSGSQPRGVQASAINVPQRDVDLRVTQSQGRGDVRIIQQPSARNGYVTVLRVNDPQGGYGRYDFDLVW